MDLKHLFTTVQHADCWFGRIEFLYAATDQVQGRGIAVSSCIPDKPDLRSTAVSIGVLET